MRIFALVCLLIILTLLSAASVSGQKTMAAKNSASAETAGAPEVKAAGYSYKGVSLGMLADDVRKKLGDPRDKTDPQDMYVFGDDESAQFLYDADHKVSAIVITFSGKLTHAPTPKDVFGEDVEPREDGGVSKMVRYPKAGYWISYNKIVGSDSMVNIAMQRIE